MKKLIIGLSFGLVIVACNRNAITGRKQFTLYNEADITTMAAGEYRSFLSANPVVTDATNKDAEMVRRVGRRISAAIKEYYANNPTVTAELNGYQWEYNLVNSKDVNAWCMPGGKIVVYTGLLSVTKDEPSLAVVMGHEIMHALGHHGNERMSKGMLQQLGGVALDVALSNKRDETRAIFNQAYGAGTQVGIMLPFARKHELEADRFGLIFAAMAGYNPQVAIGLWQRMAALSANSQKPPEFLSTHPVEERRIAELQKIMPQALAVYKPVRN